MSEHDEFVIPPEVVTPVREKRFPVIAQLAVLGVIFMVLFGITQVPQFFAKTTPDVNAPAPSAPLVVSDDTIKTIPTLEDISIAGSAAYVYDVRTKRALYSKNPDKIVPLASITKLMTTLVAHELINGETEVTVPKAAILQSGSSGLAEGERFTAGALANYAMLASSNDAAYALASAVGSVIATETSANPNQTFIQAMNIRAEELGLPNLTFLNPTGLDISATQAGAVGTAREVSFLMEYIIQNYPTILDATTAQSARVYNENGAYHQAENTNPIITKIPNLLGSKTGYTDLAGGNLTIAFDAGYNRPIIITVLGSSYDGRFTDVKKLVDAVSAALAAE